LQLRYPIRAASKLTGLSIDTLRAWERRYRAVAPVRAERGRLYSEADIRRLILLRQAVEKGHSIGSAAAMTDGELETLSRETAAWFAPQAKDAIPDELQPCLAAIDAFDPVAANLELSHLAMIAPPRELVRRFVLPLMRITGDRWERGRFHVAQEHLLSACVRNLLGGLIRVRSAPGGVPRLLFTTPAGELHEFGVLSGALLAAASGFHVTYLGPNLPAAEIATAAKRSSANAVVLGTVKNYATAEIGVEVALAASQLPGIELWLGGAGSERVKRASGLDVIALDDFDDFERELTRLKR
jgi:DNA-binding transcriptional MerR regulator